MAGFSQLWLIGITITFAGGVGFLAFRTFSRQTKHMKLILKALYYNTRELQSGVHKIDTLSTDSKEAIAFQRKSFDHQRVLFSSLNRQINKLEAMLVDESDFIESAGKRSTPPANPNRPNSPRKLYSSNRRSENGRFPITQLLEEESLKGSNLTGGAVLLEKLFAERESRISRGYASEQVTENTDAHQNVARLEGLPSLFRDEAQLMRTESDFEERRISNG